MQNIKSKGKWKIILTNSVRKLGKKGDVVEVKHGYFRNFLSNGLAVSFSEARLKEVQETLKSSFDSKLENEAARNRDLIENQYLFFSRQASGTDILFASVSTKDIAKEIETKFKIAVNYKKIFVNEPIKKIGIYQYLIDLSESISVNMFLAVGRSVEDAEKMVKTLKKDTQE